MIQAAADGVEAAIDPLAPGLDLAPFLALMKNDRVLKVFHAARQDLEIFLSWARRCPIRCSTPRSRPWRAATATDCL